MTTRTKKPKPVKARIIHYMCDTAESYIIPASAASYERMVEQMACAMFSLRGLHRCWLDRTPAEAAHWKEYAVAALASIGIKEPRK